MGLGQRQHELWLQRRTATTMRRQVEERDQGICALCGLDTNALAIEFQQIATAESHESTGWVKQRIWLREHGFARNRTKFWDMDHTIPISEGGDPHDLANVRTLCIRCHRKETNRLRARKAAARAAESS